MRRLLILLVFFVGAQPAQPLLRPRPKKATALSRRQEEHRRGLKARGGFIGKLRDLALSSVQARRRRDDEFSAVSTLQLLTGFLLLFQPLELLGWADKLGTTTMQLFVAGKFYERLVGRLLFDFETFDKPKSRLGRARKALASVFLFGLSCGLAQSGGLATVAPTVALGVALSRTFTSLVEYGASETAKARLVHKATAAVVNFDPRYFNEVEAARDAIRRKVIKDAPPHTFDTPALARFFTAAAAIALASRLQLPVDAKVYGPALVGAFEFSQAATRLYHTNEFLIKSLTLRFALTIARHTRGPLIALLEPPVRLVVFVVKNVVSVASRVVHGLVAGIDKLLSKIIKPPTIKNRAEPQSNKRNIIVPFLVRVWKVSRTPKQIAKSYAGLVKRTQRAVKTFLQDNHDTLWPWAVALAGYRVQTRQISIFGVPTFLASLAAIPTLRVAQAFAKLAAAVLAVPATLLPHKQKVKGD